MRKILLDIDNTITTPDYILQTMANVTGKTYTGEETLETYRIGDVYGLSKEADKMFWQLYSAECLNNSKPNYKTLETIYNEIINDDDMIYVITAREEEFEQLTIDWLERYNIKYDSLILVGHNSKIGFIEGLDIDVIIDDKGELFEEIEVVKDIFPNSSIANKLSEGTMDRYVVSYPYNENVKSEYRISTDGVISKVEVD